MLHLAPLAPQVWGEPEFKVLQNWGMRGGFLLHCVYTAFSPPSLGGTGVQSPPELGDARGLSRTCVDTIL
jgi:hypothetical protein